MGDWGECEEGQHLLDPAHHLGSAIRNEPIFESKYYFL